MRLMKSAPITTTQLARPASMIDAPVVERREEARAGGADIEGAGAGRAERLGDQRRGVGHDLVGRAGRDQHEVDVGGIDAGLLEGGCGRGGRVRLQPFVRCGDVALADAGAALDPIGRETQPGLDLRRGDDPRRQAGSDRCDGRSTDTATSADAARQSRRPCCRDHWRGSFPGVSCRFQPAVV